jgi:hypothetical protein
MRDLSHNSSLNDNSGKSRICITENFLHLLGEGFVASENTLDFETEAFGI